MRVASRYLHGALHILEETLRQNEMISVIFPDPTE